MEQYRIETEEEIKAYLLNLKYALDAGAKIRVQTYRRVDEMREEKYTNQYTLSELFKGEDVAVAIEREIRSLKIDEYMRTVKDLRFPNRSEMREFGRVYNGTDEVYIKVRVELLDVENFGGHTVFVMSFHYAEKPFCKKDFPYQ